jgi:hypothetical protein
MTLDCTTILKRMQISVAPHLTMHASNENFMRKTGMVVRIWFILQAISLMSTSASAQEIRFEVKDVGVMIHNVHGRGVVV